MATNDTAGKAPADDASGPTCEDQQILTVAWCILRLHIKQYEPPLVQFSFSEQYRKALIRRNIDI
jgi:hypothetical protein